MDGATTGVDGATTWVDGAITGVDGAITGVVLLTCSGAAKSQRPFNFLIITYLTFEIGAQKPVSSWKLRNNKIFTFFFKYFKCQNA